MNGNLVESLIGAVVLVVAAGFLYVAYETTDIGTRGGAEYRARFDRVNGLTVGSDVRIAGIKVGSVIRTELDSQTYQAIVRLSVRKDIALPEDTTASITSDGLLGDTYINLSPGGSPEILQPGDEIAFTESPTDLWSLIRKAVYSGDSGSDSGGGS